MEMSMSIGAFEPLDHEEMMAVDGGAFKEWAAVKGAIWAATKVGAFCGLGPVGGGIVLGCCVVAAGVAIYGACHS